MAKKKEMSIEERLKEALISVEEHPYEIPKGWEWVRLGSVVEKTQYGYTAKTADLGESKYLRITDIQENQVDWKSVPYCQIDEKEKMKYLLFEDDIVVARTGATTGKSYLVKNPNNSVFASYLIRIRSSLKSSEFIWKFMQTSNYWNQISEVSSGIAQPGVNAQKLENLSFPLPPLAEQNRIVEKLDSMLGKIKEVRELISEARETFETRKAAILNKAFTGELTAKWRDENPKEDAISLLEKINEEKMKKWREDCLEAEENEKKKPSKPKLNSVEEMLISEEEQPYELPEGWRWVNFKELVSVSSGKNLTKKELVENGTIPVYGGNGIMGYHNDFNVDSKKLILGRVGFYCGCVHITEEKSWITDNSLIVSFENKIFEMLFLYHLFIFLDLGKTSKSTAQPVISGKSLENIEIPLPPLSEQQEIVKIVESLLKAEEEVSELLNMEDSIELLEKSILDRAFRGELGTQEESDESALDMLKKMIENS